jgi:serine/threonine protein kinase
MKTAMSETDVPESPTRHWDPNASGLPVILEHYRVLGTLGQGGMGTVYLGFHINLQRFVAIKTLRVDRIQQAGMVERFVREMRLIGQMDHRNVVRAHDAGEKNGFFYLVMELLRGTDLNRMVRSRGPLGVGQACSLLRQAAVGLEYIHKTLVHRDIKPSNLMLTDGGVLKILDLGLARFREPVATEATPEGGVLGTYDYIPPEQALGAPNVDGRADIYSLGCTLYMLIVGRAPFSEPDYPSASQKLLAHCHVPVADLPAVRSWPAPLAKLLASMTAKNPRDRFATAGEAAAALAAFADDSIDHSALAASEAAAEPVMTPLAAQMVEELDCLTSAAGPPTGPTKAAVSRMPISDTSKAMTSKVPARRTGWYFALGLSACLLVGALAMWGPRAFRQADPLVGPQPHPPADDNAGADVRPLDSLRPNVHHALLDRAPFSLTGVQQGPQKWRWESDPQTVEATWHDPLLLELGTTKRARFSIEAGIGQTRWTGSIGLFFGYEEDAAKRLARQPGTKFARFQMVGVDVRHRNGEETFFVERSTAKLFFNERGEIRFETTPDHDHRQRIPILPSGENILSLQIDHGTLAAARLGRNELAELCSPEANARFAAEPYAGGLGLVSLGHHAMFGNARFFASADR